jgi:hypothetical protein
MARNSRAQQERFEKVEGSKRVAKTNDELNKETVARIAELDELEKQRLMAVNKVNRDGESEFVLQRSALVQEMRERNLREGERKEVERAKAWRGEH